MDSPYRHSVWIDVFGVLVLGAVLLGGVGYLLYHAQGVTKGVARVTFENAQPAMSEGQAGEDTPGAPRPRRFPSRDFGPGPLLGSSSESTVPRVEAPFSADWRERATPDLTGPSATSSGGDQRRGDLRSVPSGPSITSSRPFGKRRNGGVKERSIGGAGWQSEARRLAGRARALSRQLGQMDRSSPETGEAASSRERASRSAAGTGAAASGPGAPGDPSRRGDPGDPSSVPIDDHVYWLAVAGLLFGIWRLQVGA